MERTPENQSSPDVRPEKPNEVSVAAFIGLAEKLTVEEEPGARDHREANYRLPDGRVLQVVTGATDTEVSIVERGPDENPWMTMKTFSAENGEIKTAVESLTTEEEQALSTEVGENTSLFSDKAALEIEQQLETDPDFDMPVYELEEHDVLPEGTAHGPYADLRQPSNLDEVDKNLQHLEEDTSGMSDLALNVNKEAARAKRWERLQKFGKEKGFNDASQDEIDEMNSLLQSIKPDQKISQDEANKLLGQLY